MGDGNSAIDRLQAAIIKRQIRDRKHAEGNPREQALARDHSACRICGHAVAIHVHHIVAKSRGGPDSLDNLITLCSNHHIMTHRGHISAAQLHDLIGASGYRLPLSDPSSEEEGLEGILPVLNEVRPLTRIIVGKGSVSG